MKAMLEMEPSQRITAIEALADPYFDGLRDTEIEKLLFQNNLLRGNNTGSSA